MEQYEDQYFNLKKSNTERSELLNCNSKHKNNLFQIPTVIMHLLYYSFSLNVTGIH